MKTEQGKLVRDQNLEIRSSTPVCVEKIGKLFLAKSILLYLAVLFSNFSLAVQRRESTRLYLIFVVTKSVNCYWQYCNKKHNTTKLVIKANYEI